MKNDIEVSGNGSNIRSANEGTGNRLKKLWILATFSLLLVIGVLATVIALGKLRIPWLNSRIPRLNSNFPAASGPTLSTLPAIDDFLFKGYDLLKGNPNPTGSGNDPGFKGQIFAATYASGQKTGDARYSLPDGISVIASESCSLDFTSILMETVSQYSEKLSRQASVSGSTSGWGVTARFSASVDYQSASEVLSTASSTLIHSQAECSVYESGIDIFDPPPFSTNFLSGLETLPDEYDVDKYSRFLDGFGTHYVTETTMGAIFGEQSFITQSKRRELESNGLTLEAAAAVSASTSKYGYGPSVEFEGGQATEVEALQEFHRLAENRQVYTRGSRLPIEGGVAAWANSSFENPQAVTIKLARIDTIFGLDQVVRSPAVFENIRRAIDEHCLKAVSNNQVASCDPSGFVFSDFTVPSDQSGVALNPNDLYDELLPPAVCNENEFVTGFSISELAGIGIVDAILTCSDNTMLSAIGEEDITTIPDVRCIQGIDALGAYGQKHSCHFVGPQENGSVTGGDKGELLSCRPDEVLTGVCTSGWSANCEEDGTKYAHLIECAKPPSSSMRWTDPSHQGDLEGGDNDEYIGWENLVAVGRCASFRNARCDNDYHQLKGKRPSTDVVLDTEKTVSKCGNKGELISCPEGYAVTQSCGAGAYPDCSVDICEGQPGYSGIRCTSISASLPCKSNIEGEFNIIGMDVKCDESTTREFIGSRETGQRRSPEVNCGAGEQVVGIQVAVASNPEEALTRLRLVCQEEDA